MTSGFPGICYFTVCGGVFCAFPYDRGLCSDIFLHFAEKYRRVPKIGFPDDMFLHAHLFSLNASLCTCPKIGSSANISIDIVMCISIDMFIGSSIVIYLTFIDKEEEGRKEEWIFSYAQTLIVVVLIVVNFFGFLIIAPYPTMRF